VTRIFPYKLEDGDVLEIENTLPTPLTASELTEDPDTIPVSQGPKKIFLIESFDDLNNIFGKESKLSDAQKDTTWEKYKGKYVSWMGQIVYKRSVWQKRIKYYNFRMAKRYSIQVNW
jgi:hypothetical protein